MSASAKPRRRERPRRPFERAEILIIVVLAVVGALWGAAWQRTAALTEIAAVAPIMMVVIGPGLLVTYLAFRVAKGEFELRMDGYGTVVLFLAAIVGNVLTPPVAPSVTASGRMTGTLDGAPVNGAAQCTWGAGRESVATVTTELPELVPVSSGVTHGWFTTNLPVGTLRLELPSGAITLTSQEAAGVTETLPLRNGTGGIGEGDRATGSISLDPSGSAVVAGTLSWTCDAPPAD